MAYKTFRTIYLHQRLDSRLVKKAEEKDTSASRLVRMAIDTYLNEIDKKDAQLMFKNTEKLKTCNGD